jgi:hemolysin activation/secretion protein
MRITLRVFISLLGVSASAAALAAADTPGGGFQLPPVAVPDAAARAPQPEAVRVDRIAFRGNRALRSSALQAVAAPFLGRDLTAADIEELRIALTHQYVDRGYINSGVILDPEAPYRDGVLSFQVIEGRIREVRVHGLKGLRSSYVENQLRGPSGEALNTAALRERFQHLLDDPLFARINSRIQPGSDLGDAILDVDVQRARPYSLALAVNNYRPPSIGSKAYDLSGQVRDLTGVGDVLDLNLNGPLDFSGGVGYGLGWQLPLNHRGTSLALSAARTQTVVTEEPLAALHIRSKIDRLELKVSQLAWSTLKQQLSFGLGLAREKNSTTLDGLPFSFLPGASDGITRAVTARLITDYSYRSDRQYFGARLTVLHAHLLDYVSEPVAYAQPPQRYFVWTGQLHHLWEFAPLPFEVESRATVQRTHSVVSDLHSLEIGGVGTVRGYRENEVLRSNVQNFNVDLRWLALPMTGTLRPGLTLGAFFDWAAGHDVDAPTDTFSSIGLTMRMKWPHVQADLAFGAPLIHPAFVSQQHGNWQDHGVHLQIATSL